MSIRQYAPLVVLACSTLFGQGTEPKAKVTEYPAQATLPTLSLGAEYMVRSVSARKHTFFIPEYLVVEVAVFPAHGQTVALSNQHFTLQVGGKRKEILFPQSAGFVAASLKYSDWDYRPRLEAGAGSGNQGVIFGRPPTTERFPGDPRPGQTRLPAPPRAPTAEAGPEQEPPVRAEEVVADCILPDKETSAPVSGYLYFPYKGKTKSIKSLELVYKGPAGSATLRLD